MSNDNLGMEFEPRIIQSVMKSGGKKKLDALLGMFKTEAPQRVSEILTAADAVEAKAAARVLKSSAGNLGLLGLEDLCDQVLAGQDHKALDADIKAALGKANSYLDNLRKTL
jgi:HPt (histidine-containing phosphotransfer) domain-containing protein